MSVYNRTVGGLPHPRFTSLCARTKYLPFENLGCQSDAPRVRGLEVSLSKFIEFRLESFSDKLLKWEPRGGPFCFELKEMSFVLASTSTGPAGGCANPDVHYQRWKIRGEEPDSVVRSNFQVSAPCHARLGHTCSRSSDRALRLPVKTRRIPPQDQPQVLLYLALASGRRREYFG